MSKKAKKEFENLMNNPDNIQIYNEDYNRFVPNEDEIADLEQIIDKNVPILQTEYKTEDYSLLKFDEKQNKQLAPKGNKLEERKKDFEYSRDNLYDTIETSQNSMKKLAEIATQSQHPRAFEVIALLGKTITDATKALIDVHKKEQELEKEEKESNNKDDVSYTQNNIFCTTDELDKILKKLKG